MVCTATARQGVSGVSSKEMSQMSDSLLVTTKYSVLMMPTPPRSQAHAGQRPQLSANTRHSRPPSFGTLGACAVR